MQYKQARDPRKQPINIQRVSLDSDSSNWKEGHVQDISKSGAFLWHCYSSDIVSSDVASRIVFHIDNKKPIVRNCNIVRSDKEKNFVAVKFEKSLSDFELDRVTGLNGLLYLPGDDSTYELSKIDRAEVFREANQIKTCASNYFMWAMGLIIPLTMVIWSLAIEGKLTPSSISSSMIGIFLVFCVAVFSNLEKTRAILKREGFIAALDYYLHKKQGPHGYRGWVNLKHCFSECGTRRRAKICPIKIDSKASTACRDVGERKAKTVRSSKKIFPSMLDSYLSLTSFSYAIIFIALTILTLTSFAETWHITYGISRSMTLLFFGIGFAASAIIWRNGSLIIAALFIVTMLAIAGVVFTDQSLINIVSFGLGIIFGSFTWFFMRQVAALRVGHYSFETFTHMWFEIFENCIFIPDEFSITESSPNEHSGFINRFLAYMPWKSRRRK